MFSKTVASINWYCSSSVIRSISSSILSIRLIEYNSPLISENNLFILVKLFSSKSEGNSNFISPKKNFCLLSMLKITSNSLSLTNFAKDELILTL